MGQSRVFAAAIAGTTDSPVWAQEGMVWKFDVAQASQLVIHLFLKFPNTSKREQDIPLGVVTINPPFAGGDAAGAAEWVHIQGGGTGKICIGMSYAKKTLVAIGDLKSAWCSTGLVSKVKSFRKQDTQQLYALKTIDPLQIGTASTASPSLGFQINSPFIASLAFACQSQSAVYLLTPFIPGEHLFYRLQQDRLFDTDRSRFYAAEILCAMENLHELGIVYGGLRPKSILINCLGHLTIVDYHLFLSQSMTEASVAGGAMWNTAPEVLLGQAYSKSSDWWTLGCILYEMLTGMPPFYSGNPDQARRNILAGFPTLPDSLLPSARDMLLNLLNCNPDQRLGASGASEIKSHPFFDGVDWEKIGRCEYQPYYKSRHIATIFEDQAPPPLSLWDKFVGFNYQRPGSQTEGSTAVQDENIKGRVPLQTQDLLASASTRSDAAALPHSATQNHEALDEDVTWELVWEEPSQTFMLHDPLTNRNRSIPSRRQMYPRSWLPQTLQQKKEEALEWALETRHTKAIYQLLEDDVCGDDHGEAHHNRDLNISFLREWETPLEWAAEHEDMAMMELFLRHGADPSFLSIYSATQASARVALYRAVAKRNQAMARLLVRCTHNRVLRTRALGLAVDQLDTDMVGTLLAAGNDVQCDFDAADRPLPFAQSAALYEVTDYECCFEDISFPKEFVPPLVRAVREGSAPLVRLLLAHGADPNVGFHDLPGEPSSLYIPPFRLSCGRVAQLAMSLGHLDIVQLLLAAGADVNLAQPIWPGHKCEMVPRKEYLEITAGLRAAVATKEVVQS